MSVFGLSWTSKSGRTPWRRKTLLDKSALESPTGRLRRVETVILSSRSNTWDRCEQYAGSRGWRMEQVTERAHQWIHWLTDPPGAVQSHSSGWSHARRNTEQMMITPRYTETFSIMGCSPRWWEEVSVPHNTRFSAIPPPTEGPRLVYLLHFIRWIFSK